MAGRSSRTARTVAVLMGGPSAEREVSLTSGRECANALRRAGYEVTEIALAVDERAALPQRLAAADPDVVFNALHGRWGEDGCVQGLMEWLGYRYTHSGVLASALAMDKTQAKNAYRMAGLPVVESVIASAAEIATRHVLPPPYVVKPNDEGSSVGIHIVRDADSGFAPVDPDAPGQLMVETYVPGRELTTAVMGDRALGVTEILTDSWYDYDAKYSPGGSRHVCPAEIPAEITELCCDYALRAHRVLGCKGVSRTDFRWDDSRGADGLILLETNTQPGMTPVSLAPEQARAVGIDFVELCRWIVEDALCRD